MTDIELLKSLYNNLDFTLSKTKKRKKNSILTDILKIKSNDRLKLLSDSADNLEGVEKNLIDILVTKGLIREDEFGGYYISAHGVWEIESQDKSQIKELIRFFDEEYFTNKSIGKGLNDKEKVILFSLIALRTFSNETALDLKKSDLIKNSCAEVLEFYNQKLAAYGIIKMPVTNFWGQTGNEHKVSHVIRHTGLMFKIFCKISS